MSENSFFSFVENPEIFDFKGINLSKYFYDNYVTKQTKEKTSPVYKDKALLNTKSIVIRIYHFLLGIINIFKLLLTSKPGSRYLFAGSGNRYSTINNIKYDQYNANIIDYLGRSNFINMQATRKKKFNKYSPDLVLHDFHVLLGLMYILINIIMKKEINKYAKLVYHSYPQLGLSIREISKSVSTFYTLFSFYHLLIKIFKPKGVFILCHYSFHYLIAACKKEKILTIELMHGLIAKSHPHYCIPDLPHNFRNIFNEVMMPDYIGVYGDYWRNNLISGKQFLSERIINIGYYLKTPLINFDYRKRSSKKTILITTQPTVQNEFLKYIKFLKSNLDPKEWVIVVKPHSSEDISAYCQLIEPGFIEVEYTNVYHLLQQADIHISVYSTVIYEAILYNIINYSLYIEKVSNYCDEILASGVAQRLNTNELPKYFIKNQTINRKIFFDSFNPIKLFGLFS